MALRSLTREGVTINGASSCSYSLLACSKPVAAPCKAAWSIAPRMLRPELRVVVARSASAGVNDSMGNMGGNGDKSAQPIATGNGYSLKETTALVETAMLAAVSGLAYLVATVLKIENTVGYFLPLPIVLCAMRSTIAAGWKTMMATAFLLVVLLGPLRAVSYILLHGLTAAMFGTLWKSRFPWWPSIVVSSIVRLVGQASYLVLSSVTMNENFFWVVLSNVHNMLDQISATVGWAGTPSTTAVASFMFALLLVNSLIYCFLLHVVYRLILQAMGFDLGPLPGLVRKYLYAGMPEPQQPSSAGSAPPLRQQ